MDTHTHTPTAAQTHPRTHTKPPHRHFQISPLPLQRRLVLFLKFVQRWDPADPSTWSVASGGPGDLSLPVPGPGGVPARALFSHFGLSPSTAYLVGHALALEPDSRHLDRPARETVLRCRLYRDSLLRFPGLGSPFLYPSYGLGELPQAFARLSAVHGGVYILRQGKLRVLFEGGGQEALESDPLFRPLEEGNVDEGTTSPTAPAADIDGAAVSMACAVIDNGARASKGDGEGEPSSVEPSPTPPAAPAAPRPRRLTTRDPAGPRRACGVRVDVDGAERDVRVKLVVGDPSYFAAANAETADCAAAGASSDDCLPAGSREPGCGCTRPAGRVARAVALLAQPAPCLSAPSKGAPVPDSAQIILPARALGRSSDVYVTVLGHSLGVCPKGHWVATAQCAAETARPELELAPALALLGPALEVFHWTEEARVPVEDGRRDRCFVSASYDPTSHFESTVDDVLGLYQRVTGRTLDLEKDIVPQLDVTDKS